MSFELIQGGGANPQGPRDPSVRTRRVGNKWANVVLDRRTYLGAGGAASVALTYVIIRSLALVP